MTPSRAWPAAAGALLCLLTLPGRPAAAVVEGPCTASFNGVEVSRIDSLSSPLLLGHQEALVFSGEDQAGTLGAEVSLLLGPATLARASASSIEAVGGFTVSLDLAGVSDYAVGLLRVRGATDNCVVEAWLRIGGRLPFTTLTGIGASALAMGGLTAQVTALFSRRRWSAAVAASAGLATGVGGALLGQQFGRLQASLVSVAAAVVLAAVAGLVTALILHRAAPAPHPGPAEPLEDHEEEEEEEQKQQEQDEDIVGATPPETDRPSWCYVMAVVEVLDLDDHTRVVATLHPATWYLVERRVGDWAQVVAAKGVEGWVPAAALHRGD